MIARGFGAATVLMALVLLLFITARLIGGRAPGDLSKRQQRRRVTGSARDHIRVSEARLRREAAELDPDLIPGLRPPEPPTQALDVVDPDSKPRKKS